MSMHPASGLWWCWACGEGGDLFEVIAIAHNKDIKRDFPLVLEIAADIAGGALPGGGRGAAAPKVANADESTRSRRDAGNADAVAHAGVTWQRLARRSEVGETYLRRDRGLDVEVLLGRDVVRFFQQGDPALALRSLDGSACILNVVRRCMAGRPKVLGLRGCPNRGALVGAVSELCEGRNVAVIVEGVADALTAALAWPQFVVLGAHGAGQMASVAASAAGRIRALGGRLLLVPHADADEAGLGAGELAAVRAVDAARGAGLRLDVDLELVDLGDAKDLNEAWRRGWRPRPLAGR